MLSHELAQVQANFAHRNQKSKVMKRKKLFFKECHLAGRQYHDANEVWEEYLLGYLPRTSNTEIAQLLEMGWASIFECRISKINEDAHYENQIRLTIRIKQNQQAQNCVES